MPQFDPGPRIRDCICIPFGDVLAHCQVGAGAITSLDLA